MVYKNSFKLLLSNFSLIYKVLIFLLINLTVIFGISYVVVLPVINLLANANWFAAVENVYINFLNNPSIAGLSAQVGVLFNDFVLILTNNLNVIGINLILLAVTLFVLGNFLNGFYNLIVSNVLYNYMSNNLKFGFTASFIETFYKNLKYNLVNLITKLPITILIWVLLYFIFKLLVITQVPVILIFFALLLLFILLQSFKITIFSSWAPSMLVFNKGVFKDISKGISITNRRFSRVYLNAFYLVFTLFIINVASALATFGFALFLTIPITIVMLSCFNMVAFYSNYGMRYYVDEFNVIVPKKMENTDKVSSVKHIV